MANTDQTLDARRERLSAAIAAARRRAGAEEGSTAIGGLLGGINDELDLITHEDRDAAEQAYNKIEARLQAERIRIEDDLAEAEEEADR